jgi:hypothetical protein
MDDTLKKLEKILEDLNSLEIDHSKMDFREFLETLVEHFIRTMDAIGMSTTVVTRHPKVKLISSWVTMIRQSLYRHCTTVLTA